MIAERVYPVVREVVRGTRGAPRVHLRLVVVVARVIRGRRRGRGGPSRKRLARQTPHPPRRLQRPPALREPRLVVIQRGEHVVTSLAPARGDPPRGIEPGSARPAARERTDRGIVERRRLRVVLALRQLGRGNDGAAPTAPVDHVRHAPHVPVHVPPRVPAGPEPLDVRVHVKVFHRRVSRDDRAVIVHVAPRPRASQAEAVFLAEQQAARGASGDRHPGDQRLGLDAVKRRRERASRVRVVLLANLRTPSGRRHVDDIFVALRQQRLQRVVAHPPRDLLQ
mmetsp:Transcript_2005/g.8023  ORF Transcript_2005/g.8023 Transcript_2005/m.8023 type:complete len:281 (-) Transcript_2005:868-1710(-)